MKDSSYGLPDVAVANGDIIATYYIESAMKRSCVM